MKKWISLFLAALLVVSEMRRLTALENAPHKH